MAHHIECYNGKILISEILSAIMSKSLTVYFVRHGEVENRNNIYYGRLPRFGLSKRGYFEAQTVANYLANKSIKAIFTSPLLRARQTANIVLATQTLPKLHVSNLLNEVYSPFDGCPKKEIEIRSWDVYSGTKMPYEQPSNVLKRSTKFIEKVMQHYPKENIVAVTHGDLIAFTILCSLGVEITNKNKILLTKFGLPENFPAPGSISKFTVKSADCNAVVSMEYINVMGECYKII